MKVKHHADVMLHYFFKKDVHLAPVAFDHKVVGERQTDGVEAQLSNLGHVVLDRVLPRTHEVVALCFESEVADPTNIGQYGLH
eukprot:35040-Eustigmatos_ZCMA.PRE.1